MTKHIYILSSHHLLKGEANENLSHLWVLEEERNYDTARCTELIWDHGQEGWWVEDES